MLSYSFSSVATFVALNTALTSLGTSMQDVAEDVLDLLCSSSKVIEVKDLLNYETHELRAVRKDRALPIERHHALSSDVDAVIRRWEVNAADAQATTRLIAETLALDAFSSDGDDADAEGSAGTKTSWGTPRASKRRGGADVLGDLTDLVTGWASLLDDDPSDEGGSMLIFDVHYAVEHAGTQTSIFEGMCVNDLTSGSAATEGTAADDDANDEARHTNPVFFKELSGNVWRQASSPTVALPEGSEPACRHPVRLPAGVIVGLPATERSLGYTGDADKRAAFALMQMLRGRERPNRGFARCMLDAELVEGTPQLISASLFDNLVQGAACPISGRLPSRQAVWALCRRVGMSEALIGRTHDELLGWELTPLSSKLHSGVGVSDTEDLVLASMVRALFERPEALLLYRVGDGWALQRQRQLFDVLRSYIDGSLMELTHAHIDTEGSISTTTSRRRSKSRQSRRSVIVCAADVVLSQMLTEGDVVLSIDSPREATLHRADAFYLDPAATLAVWATLEPPLMDESSAPAARQPHAKSRWGTLRTATLVTNQMKATLRLKAAMDGIRKSQLEERLSRYSQLEEPPSPSRIGEPATRLRSPASARPPRGTTGAGGDIRLVLPPSPAAEPALRALETAQAALKMSPRDGTRPGIHDAVPAALTPEAPSRVITVELADDEEEVTANVTPVVKARYTSPPRPRLSGAL